MRWRDNLQNWLADRGWAQYPLPRRITNSEDKNLDPLRHHSWFDRILIRSTGVMIMIFLIPILLGLLALTVFFFGNLIADVWTGLTK